ncbi:MAG TPA: penicillin acylase family protein [Terriglobales bacterium]
MAAAPTVTSLPRSPGRFRRALSYLLIAVALVAAISITWLYVSLHASLPQLDGSREARGLGAEVTVTRDAHGVPTIVAQNLEDLFFAQGYVTAQDRLWQMDIMRRFAAGELAEILGPDLVRHDREQRILGMRVIARKTILSGSPAERARFEAYARGVNAYIESQRSHLPLEFRLLGYTPQLWTAEDSGLIAAQMVKDLTHYSYRNALLREKILAKLGPELTAQLFVNSSVHDRVPASAGQGIPRDQNSGEDKDDLDLGNAVTRNDDFFPALGSLGDDSDPALLVGSNNWVVSGAHTVSGKPLLSNDMHLGHQMPNLWYEAHLRCGAFDVAGVTLPGFPYVIVGHNQRIAWGFTNLGGTVEDVYVETFDGSGRYLTPSGWQEAGHRKENIHVKKGADVEVDVTLTRHGPIISDLIPGESRKLALRWTPYEGLRNGLFDVDSAQNWDQFRRAFSQFDAPGQNVVYGDVDGNIGYQATGKIPIRASGDGSLPENGSDDSHEWIGYVPYDKMPRVYNPASGILATANGRVTPANYGFSISTGWEAPWRTERIYQVLESGKKFGPADMLALQTDIYSAFDKALAEQFVEALSHASTASKRARQAAEILRGWNGHMSAGSAAAAITVAGRAELSRLLLEDKLGPLAANYHWSMQSVWLENVLQSRPKQWLPANYSGYDELLTAALEATLRKSEAPRDVNAWRWGQVNSIEIQNPVLGKVPLLRRWSGTGLLPQAGCAYCVKAVTPTHGPSERFTADLSNLDQSTLNVVTGESGVFLSAHYLDQWTAWYGGHTFLLPFSDSAVEKTSAHRLVLRPGR